MCEEGACFHFQTVKNHADILNKAEAYEHILSTEAHRCNKIGRKGVCIEVGPLGIWQVAGAQLF